MKRDRKAQITAFILLSLVILSIFLFLFYVRGQIQRSQSESKVDLVAETIRKMPALNYYITLCLKDSSENALILLGKQGGSIYTVQGGMIGLDSAPVFRYQDDNVTYGMVSMDTILQNAAQLRLMGQPGYPAPPDYPCIQTSPPISYPCPPYAMNTNRSLLPAQFFPFGIGTLPVLCMPNGPNDISMNVYPFPCPAGSYGPDSMQEQMKQFIASAIQNCTNFSEIRKQIPYNITTGKPEITPIIGENDIIVKAAYPINITVGTYGSVRLFDFEVRLQVRLKKIYGLANSLVYNDANFIDYNITGDFRNTLQQSAINAYWDPYISVEDFCPYCKTSPPDLPQYTTILQINDSASNMRGSPYYFRFAMENRIPALEWIHKTGLPEKFDYIVQEGGEIKIEPRGYAPDEADRLSYSYAGWKQDYDEIFDPGCCKEVNPDASVSCTDDPWACVKKVPYSALQDCMKDYEYKDSNVWTTSDYFLMPGLTDPDNIHRSANYTAKTTDPDTMTSNPSAAETDPVCYPCSSFDETTAECTAGSGGVPYSRDLGPHVVTAYVCDDEGKCDWQNMTIMVTDIPRPHITITPPYAGFGYASLEDPFTLDAAGSSIFSASSYEWIARDSSGNIVFDYSNIATPVLKIPSANPDILTITEAPDFFKTPGCYTLELKMGSASTTKTLDVKECVPFAGTGDPYPYNTVADPFMAQHSCCDDNGNFIPVEDNKACHNRVRYGSIYSFSDYDFKDSTLSTYDIKYDLSGFFTTARPADTSPYSNDVFYSEFNRYCSGDRGNICTGLGEEIRHAPVSTPSKTCDDLDASIQQDERCQGPPPGIFYNAADANCINYAPGSIFGETFESAYGINGLNGAADGKCSGMSRCTNGIDFRQNGKFWCQGAVCDGNGYCSEPETSSCVCDSTACDADLSCNGIPYGSIAGSGFCNSATKKFCMNNCLVQKPDDSQAACSCYGKTWVGTIAARSPPLPAYEKYVKPGCCGDNDEVDEKEERLQGKDNTHACCDNSDANGVPLGGKECILGGKCLNRKESPETCDGIDNDCDGAVDEGCDGDSDGYCAKGMNCIPGKFNCPPDNHCNDCDDTRNIVNPGKMEVCGDGLDNNCNGLADCSDNPACPPCT